jgi:hypothetical protein
MPLLGMTRALSLANAAATISFTSMRVQVTVHVEQKTSKAVTTQYVNCYMSHHLSIKSFQNQAFLPAMHLDDLTVVNVSSKHLTTSYALLPGLSCLSFLWSWPLMIFQGPG